MRELRGGEGEKNHEMEGDEPWVSDWLGCGRGAEKVRGGEVEKVSRVRVEKKV